MIRNLLKVSAVVAVSCFTGVKSTQAQTFVHPHAYEFPYHGGIVYQSDEASAYSFRNPYGTTAWGDVDVYLAGYGTGLSEVTVIFTRPGDPTNVYYRETFRYDDASSFSVGAVYNAATGGTQILVAYQWAGFHVDVYDITTSPTNPVVLNTSIPLLISPSTSFWGHRIRLDAQSSDLRRAAVVFDDPATGQIRAVACFDGNWGSVANVGTLTGLGADVAMTESNNTPYLRLVHHDATGTSITLSTVDFNSLWSALPGAVVPASIEDVHSTTPISSRIKLDCPDIDDTRSWAYTYTTQNYVNVHSLYTPLSSIPGTVSVNTGVLGNADISTLYDVYSPSLHYGNKANPKSTIMVGWYANSPTYHGYIALEMKPDGSGLLSDPDYLELPNAATPAAYPDLPNTGLAFSKSDIDLAPDFLYAAYYDIDASSSTIGLHHAFHKWGDVVFKEEVKFPTLSANIYPNPFTDVLHTTINATEQGAVNLKLVDINGRVVSQRKYEVQKGTATIAFDRLQNVLAGTYFLNTELNGKKISTETVVKY